MALTRGFTLKNVDNLGVYTVSTLSTFLEAKPS